MFIYSTTTNISGGVCGTLLFDAFEWLRSTRTFASFLTHHASLGLSVAGTCKLLISELKCFDVKKKLALVAMTD